MSTTPFANADSYKLSHWIQYPDNVVKVFSNFTPRKSRIPEQNKFILFGLQMFLKDLASEFQQGFFDLPEKEAVEAFDAFYSRFFGESNEDSNARVRELHQLGYLPLCVKALPEGSAVKHGVPVFTVVNTHNRFPWLTNFIESYMSCEIWHSCTSATTAAYFRQTFANYAEMSSDLDFMVDFQGHDFSMRGLPCIEAAAKSGMAHLLSFKGTDNLPSFEYADFYYFADAFSQREQLLGTSVPATEHSTMCAGGKDTEQQTFQRLLTLYPKGIISVVSDTWDFWKVVTEMLPQLKDQIMARDGKLVIRPDSSPKTPVEMIIGDKDAVEGTPEYKGLIECLWDTFGGTVNSKGYKELDSHIGAIYGDSITKEYQEAILAGLVDKGFSSTNIVLGIGSYTYQYVTRDTHGLAFKATAVQVENTDGSFEWMPIFKDPLTDNSGKKSAKGLLAVVKDEEGEYTLLENVDEDTYNNCELQPVFLNGDFMNLQNFFDIRKRVQEQAL